MRRKLTATIAAVGVAVLALTGCTEPTADEKSRDDAYQKVMERQPGKTLEYSPTRETINFWVDTWNEEGKLSYVYLQNTSGDVIGYYVLKGLPVSYCAQISPPDYVDHGSSGSNVARKAPANDGAYYGEGNCNTFYGQDATSGSYIEYTAGLGINVLLFSEPMPRQDHSELKPLGETEVKK